MRRDPVELEIFKSLYHSIAEEMGATLRRTAFSPNIKERRDYSCAVFDGDGEVIAMGDHMPVHLGSMPMSVKVAVQTLSLERGDVAILNDPYAGGTHLPDITLVLPVFVEDLPRPVLYVAARAHHADVGGTFAGSMGPGREIFQEGLRIPPIRIVRDGSIDREVLSLILLNVRTPAEREGDLAAQIGACQVGERRLHEMVQKYGLSTLETLADELLLYSDRLMRATLRKLPAGKFMAEDFLDDDGVSDQPIRIAVSIELDPDAETVSIDFAGSSPQVSGSVNAVYAITYSACFYVLRCLLGPDAPATAGLMYPVKVVAPLGTVVNAQPPAAVAGGNVETSQRIVDVLLRALSQAIPDRIPAAASGTMNNLTIGGIDLRVGDSRTGNPFTYYETIAGGMGARPDKPGISGVHTHMTNSLNTPAEALEYSYPLRVRRYALRPESGGGGKHPGGDGIIREIEVLTDCEVTLLSERRTRAPWGLHGGSDGAPGKTTVIRNNGSVEIMPGKFSTRLQSGERIRIESPGGGGWGRLSANDLSSKERL